MTTTTLAETAVTERLRELRVIPVATVPAGRAAELGEMLVRAGLPCLEIAMRNAEASTAIEQAVAVENLLVGAGTVLSVEQAEAAAAAGAHFAVAPGTNDAVVRRCQALGLPFFPGVSTPSEIEHARAAGLRTLKFFPAAAFGGVALLRAVSETYPDVGFIPTGGISSATLGDYLELPCVVACGGSWLVDTDNVRNGRFDVLEERVRDAIRIAAS